MRILAIVMCSALLLVGCKTKPEEVEVPDHILDKEKMVAVMADIHLAESYGYMLRVKENVRTTLAEREYAKVLKTHNITMDEFKKSYDWYMEHPSIFDLMYDDVITLIKESEQYAKENIQKDEPEKPDSITPIPIDARPVTKEGIKSPAE